MEILFYADGRGRQPVYEWIKEMSKTEPETHRTAIHFIEYLKVNGKQIQAGAVKNHRIKKLKNTDDIWQLRINENRVLFFYFAGDSIVLTTQFKKKKDKTPPSEIKRAEERKTNWINRKQT